MREDQINALCQCGSGRKFKNCCSKKKSKVRYKRIKFKVDNVPTQKVQFRICLDGTNGFELKAIDENLQEVKTTMYQIEEYFERENKNDKVIFGQPIIKNQYVKDVNLELIKYDALVAIDTSYELIEETLKIAFTSVMIFSKMSKDDDSTYNYQQITNVLEWDATGIDKPENLMYADVIENLRLHNLKYNQCPNAAVIIDSDLGNINLINERIKPIYQDYYLPKNFSLFYASTDTGSENLQNKLLKLCDTEAKNALKKYKNDIT